MKPPAWRWSAPKDAWAALAPHLTDGLLDEFQRVVLDVLNEENPVFTMPREERFYASIHGKVRKHSDALRQGLAGSLARLSRADGALKSAVAMNAGSSAAVSIVRQLLRAEWIAWASLSDVLPLLAEAAPDQFLDALFRSLDAGHEGVVHLFAEEGEHSSPHVGLLWALERLGWSPARMPRVARALAQLARADPGGRLANRPSASLARLFNPFRPSTNAEIDIRIAILRQLHSHYPATAWDLTMKHVSGLRGGVVFASNTPQFLDDRDDDRVASEEELNRFAVALIGMVLEHAGGDSARWLELVKARYAIELFHAGLLEELERRIVDGRVTDSDQLLWAGVRQQLNQTYLAGKDDTNPHVVVMRRIYTALTPTDPIRAVAWLFGAPIHIPERFGGGWREEGARVTALQDSAVTDLIQSGGTANLIALARQVKDPASLGRTLARSALAHDLSAIVLDTAADEWRDVRPAFFAVFSSSRAEEWTRGYLEHLIAENRLEEAAKSTRFLPWRRATWDLISVLSPELQKAYWSTEPVIFPQDGADAERVVAELLAVGASAHAFEVAGHNVEHLSSATLIRVVTDALKVPYFQGSGWYVQQIFKKLVDDPTVPDDSLVGLELSYLPGLEEPFALDSLRIFRALEREPELFADLVDILYKPEDDESEEPPEDEAVVEKRKAAAHNVYRLFEAWHGYPGRGLDGPEREARLAEWATAVLAHTARSRRPRAGEMLVAQVLARVSAAPDGIWPCNAARTLIEQGRQQFRDSLSVAKRNRRGIVGKRPFEGGHQEWDLARGYRENAERLRQGGDAYETARLLDDMAEYYERAAAKEDVRGEDERLDAGADRDSD